MAGNISDFEEKIRNHFNDHQWYLKVKENSEIGSIATSGEYERKDLISLRRKLDNDYLDRFATPGENLFGLIAYLQLRVLLEPDPGMYEDFLNEIDINDLPLENKYFLWAQCRNMQFTTASIISDKTDTIYMKIYKDLVEEYKSSVSVSLGPIPISERNANGVVIFTSQFVTIAHGPTKSCFYRAKALIQEENKDVMIINTNDLMPDHGIVPLFRMGIHNSNKILDDANNVMDDDVKIPYFQCDTRMPNVDIINVILETVRELKPKFIVNIGGFNITANLANDIIPVVCIGMGPSQLQYDYTDYFTCSLKLTDDVYKKLEKYGGKRDALIPSVFTSDLKDQTEHHTRSEYNIPEDKTIFGVVGGRLDSEVNEEFIGCMKKCLTEDMLVVFMGTFKNYNSVCERDQWFKEHTMFIGFVKDILSHMELCDIYLNPTRLGGGTSSVEAMSKGVVPVTINFGDVAYNVGEDFVLENYDQMAEKIRKLVDDHEYYKEMSQKAKERAAFLCDTKHRFIETIHELERRIEEN